MVIAARTRRSANCAQNACVDIGVRTASLDGAEDTDQPPQRGAVDAGIVKLIHKYRRSGYRKITTLQRITGGSAVNDRGAERIWRLSAARWHLMVCLEVCAAMGDQFTVGEVVEGFDASNLCTHQRRVARHVFDKFVLGLCGSRNENGPSIGNGLRHTLKEGMILRRVAATNAVGFVMNVSFWIVRAQYQLLNFAKIEMENAGFKVVDPDDCMMAA